MTRRCKKGAHGAEIACDRMGLVTDGDGFPHRSVLVGRIATQHCAGECGVLVVAKETPSSRLLHLPVVVWAGSSEGLPIRPFCPSCHRRWIEEELGA